MRGNAACDQPCNVLECNWDGLDCGCAPLCNFSDLGVCKAECLVIDCNFDNLPGYPSCSDPRLSLAAQQYSLLSRNFTAPYSFSALCSATSTCSTSSWNTAQTVCSSRCNVIGCAYSQGNCVVADTACVKPKNCASCGLTMAPEACLRCDAGFVLFFTSCVPQCPTGYALHELVTNVCTPLPDTSSAADPFHIFVQSSANPVGTGAYEAPFDSFAAALDAVSTQHAIVYLLSGQHLLSKCAFAPYIMPMGQSPASGSPLLYSRNLTISGFFCGMDHHSPKHPLCATQRPVLLLDNLRPVTLLIRGNVTFRGVEFFGGSSLVAGCSAELCTYCARISTGSQGVLVDDRGNAIDSTAVAPATACAAFLSQRFITVDVNASMTLFNVSISNFKQGFRSIVYFTWGNVTLNTVNFTNVTVGMYAKPTYSLSVQTFFDSVIVQENPTDQPYVNASLILDYVNVYLLNNGYEYSVNLSYGGLLSVQGLRTVSLTHSRVFYNLIFRSSLITVGNFVKFTMDSCEFDTVYAGMFLVRLVPNVAITDVVDSGLTHIVVRNTSFARCAVSLPGSSTSGVMVSVYMLGGLYNIVMDSLTFTDTFSQVSLVSVTKLSSLTSSDTSGSTLISRVAGLLVSTLIPKKTARFSQIVIESSVFAASSTSAGLVNLNTLANVEIAGLKVNNSGDAKGVESVNTKAILFFTTGAWVYLSRPAAGLTYTACSTPVLFRSLYNVTLSNVTISDTECRSSTGTGGLVTSGTNTGDFRVVNASFLRVSGQATTTAVCLHVQTTGNINVTDFSAQSVTASKAGCMRLSSPQVILLSRVTVANSKSEGGQLQLLNFQNVTVVRANLTSNLSTKEAGVSLTPIAGISSAYVQIVSSRFQGNTGLIGTGIYMTGDITAITPVTLQVTDCQFVGNIGSSSGSGILIDDSNSMGANSFIRDCQFSNNTVNEAVLYFAFKLGSLELSSIICNGSVLDPSASIASLSSVGCVLGEFKATDGHPPVIYIYNSRFERNQGVAMISINSANGQALIVSRNNTFMWNAGRAIFVDKAQMQDTNSIVMYNSRAGIYLTGESICNVTSTSFLHNYGKMSGAVYLGGSSACRFTACVFRNNSADSGNGAIYVEQSSQITMDDSYFLDNVALGRGAAISLFGTKADNWVIDTLFEGNLNGEAGTVLALSSAIRLSNVTIRGNKGTFAPGILAYFSDVVVDASFFSDQNSEAGSFIHTAIDSNTTVSFSSFSNSFSSSEGGALYLLSAQLSILSCHFTNVSASRGALLYASSNSEFLIRDSYIARAAAVSVQGGVIYTIESQATITNTTFSLFTNNGIVGVNQKRLSLTGVDFVGKG